MSVRGAFALVVAVVVWSVVDVAAAATTSAPAPVDPGRLVFLLEYVGSDYGGAVRDGNVVNAAEYGEVLRFTQEIIRGYEARRKGSDGVARGLHELQQLIERRAPATDVAAAARRLVPPLAKALGAPGGPTALPNVAAGRRLWVSDCAPCHGVGGGGDGPSAAGMDPPPTPFRGDFLDQLTPRRVFNTLTFGIEGTAMPSFAAAYTERQRWDVAFFVLSLRIDFEPKRPPDGTRFTLDELATSSNAELLARLRAKRPDATPTEVDWFRANFPSPGGGSVPFAGPDAAGPGVNAALQMQQVFAAVADRIFPRVVGVTGYVRDDGPTPTTPHPEGWGADGGDELRYPGFRPLAPGSGFVVDDDGYILSCDHLVRDERGEVAAFVDVELQDQSHLAARVIGAEPTLDLAVLRVADAGHATAGGPPLEFADSDHVELGQWLIGLGDPPGPGKAFAVGLVSAPPERQCYQSERSATRVQSSLVVPADGLGGPITDILGHVVGMSVRQPEPPGARPPDGPTATHILPANLVLNLYEALKIAQSKDSPWIGVSVLELPLLRRKLGEQARAIAIPETGVYIDDVFDPSPASKAGVRSGDFLLALGGHRLLSVGDFQTWLYVSGIGKDVELSLQREGRPVDVTVPIEVRPASATSR